MISWEVTLPYSLPQLSPNKRMMWAQRARLTKQIRQAVAELVAAENISVDPPVTVCLYYRPAVNRRRDADNLVGDLKVACDAIVDAGVVPDDTPEFMAKLMPVIVPAVKGDPARLWLEITKGE